MENWDTISTEKGPTGIVPTPLLFKKDKRRVCRKCFENEGKWKKKRIEFSRNPWGIILVCRKLTSTRCMRNSSILKTRCRGIGKIEVWENCTTLVKLWFPLQEYLHPHFTVFETNTHDGIHTFHFDEEVCKDIKMKHGSQFSLEAKLKEILLQ